MTLDAGRRRRAAALPRPDGAPLNGEHWALMVTLVIDVMKPATFGFVIPDMSAGYCIDESHVSLLALATLSGMSVGSMVRRRIADRFGQRAATLLSALMLVGTANRHRSRDLAVPPLERLQVGGAVPCAYRSVSAGARFA